MSSIGGSGCIFSQLFFLNVFFELVQTYTVNIKKSKILLKIFQKSRKGHLKVFTILHIDTYAKELPIGPTFQIVQDLPLEARAYFERPSF